MKYIIDHDLHLHSRLSSCSRHPEQTCENLLRYAKEMGYSHICLTDHFWDSEAGEPSGWYRPQNYEHVTQALPLPTADEVRFDFGCEADMDKDFTLGITRETIDKFDFVIIPTSHLHMSGFTIPEDMISVQERAKFYMARNHALLDMDLPFHKMGLAHFTCGLMENNCEGSRDDIFAAISDSELAEFFERVAAKGMGVELNVPLKDCTSEAVLRPYGIAQKCGCKFYLGSDAHTPEGLSMARQRFEAITEALNLTEDDKFPFVAR